jgi:DNA-binding NarL/FixJ family response regulator
VTRILIVDDDSLVRTGLRTILESASDLRVVAEAADGDEVVDAVRAHRPDVVLMDVRMPRVDGLEAVRRVVALGQPPRIVMLTTFDLDAYVFDALENGVDGFLLKDTPPRELIQAVRSVAAGHAMLSPTVTRRVVDQYTAMTAASGRARARKLLAELTPRERDVLLELARGHSNARIGQTLFLSEATVKSHVSHVIAKLGVENRVQVATVARDAGLLPP